MSEKFKLEGFYDYSILPERRETLNGELNILEKGYFEEEMADSSDLISNVLIKGYLKREHGFDKLFFLKFDLKSEHANLAYLLERPSTENFEGDYQGYWGRFPFEIWFNQKYNSLHYLLDKNFYLLKNFTMVNLKKI